jgi:DNA-directed RNA polymerase subunit RPC12/RpoP
MLVFDCHVCRTKLSAEESQAGKMVRCPQCLTTLRVPTPKPVAQLAAAGVGVGASASAIAGAGTFASPRAQIPASAAAAFRSPNAGGKRYGFNCGYCSSRLEATESMAAQDGQCPTCGNNITIPILDRYGRLIDPKTRQIIKQDPHPVHAYAAAGDRAPHILRQQDGKQIIRCPRCSAASPITANNCKACGMPFTMEGTTLEAAGTSNGFCVASLVLGIIGLPAMCTFITPLLAIIFGVIGYMQVTKTGSEGGGKGMAIAGMACGAVGCLLAIWWYTSR